MESLKLYFNFRSLKCLKPSWTRVKSVITLIFWQTYTAVGAVVLCKEEKAESDTFYLVRVDSFFWKNVFFALKVEICLAHTVCEASFTEIIWKRYLRYSFLKTLYKSQTCLY